MEKFAAQQRKLRDQAITGGLLLCVGVCFYPVAATAQIAGDNSLATEVNGNRTAVCNRSCVITGGTVAGEHLFHSFRQFSIPTGGIATFDHASTVRNIFARVTGRSPSAIDGQLRAGAVNLFLLNPNGIIFGANASLNMGGSFLGSTADRLLFDNGAEFSAQNPTVPASLLTVSVPVGLQFGANPGNIRVQGSGNQLSFDPQTFEIVQASRLSGLEVAAEQTLALVGGNLTLRGGNLIAPQGRIEVGSVGAGSVVSLSPLNSGWQLDYSRVNRFQTVALTQAASINASGAGGGTIRVQGQRVSLSGGSAILTDTLGNVGGGQLAIRADRLTLSGLAANAPFASGIYADTTASATAAGGNIFLNTRRLHVADGAQIGANTFGLAPAGRLRIRADQITLEGGSPLGPSGLFASVGLNATGQGGDLSIQTRTLRITNGARISVSSEGRGATGNLTVSANDIRLVGFLDTPFGAAASGLTADMGSAATGQGGDLQVLANRIRLRDGAQISSGTFGAGNAGSVLMQAEAIDLEGGSVLPSGIFAPVDFGASGRGGQLTLQTERLRIREGAQVATSTLGSGNAGNLRVEATESVQLVGQSPNGDPSGLFASALSGTGAGGNLTVNTDGLVVQDGASVSVRNSFGQGVPIPPSQGAAGNLDITARTIQLRDRATLTAETLAGDRGNIRLRADQLILRRNSRISTNAQGAASGGNIQLGLSGFLVTVPTENNDITANAVLGNGGQVDITARSLIGIEPRPTLTAFSDITASSEFGISGVIRINTRALDPVQQVAALPETPGTPELLQGCQPGTETATGRFVDTGRGGVRPTPYEPLTSSEIVGDIQPPRSWIEEWDAAYAFPDSEPVPESETPQIVEAQGWVVNAQGEVVLVPDDAVSASRCRMQAHLPSSLWGGSHS